MEKPGNTVGYLESKPVRILSDAPLVREADFGFDAYVKTISGLIANKENNTPLVIGVYGKWGSGKTTLMENIRTELVRGAEAGVGKDSPFRICKPVWFQAWKYKNEDEILAALIREIFISMEQAGFFTRCRAKIEEVIKGLNQTKLTAGLIKKIGGVSTGEFFKSLDYKNKLGFYDIFQTFFDDFLWTYLSWRPKTGKFEQWDDTKGALVVFIDDLDRCPGTRIVDVLETVKLFMDKKGCVFVIGADNEIIIKALRDTYKDDAPGFMDKIVQVHFNLPRIQDADFRPLVERVIGASNEGVEILHPFIVRALDSNPRRVKRLLNDFSLMKGLVSVKQLNIEEKDLLVWNILEKGFPDFYALLKREDEGPRSLAVLHDVIDRQKKQDSLFQVSPEKTKEKENRVANHLTGFAKDRSLLEILDEFRPRPFVLRQLSTLSEIVEPSDAGAPKEKTRTVPGEDSENMTFIPSGEFIYQNGEKRTIDKDYEIGIYPVTNKDYERFIRAGGYRDEAFWDSESLAWRSYKKAGLPKNWEDPDYNDPEQPVTGVSHHEARAYAAWLTAGAGEKYEYRLPTEEEWERAARGDKGNEYPWGDKFDPYCCNHRRSDIGKPSRVTVYPNGISPYGCYDMAGNVWEWTGFLYDKDRDYCTLRGGAFTSDIVDCRCAAHFINLDYRGGNLGFRCVRVRR
ncbi:MAG: SUMF1/EgtB/PvdO family nonheme iron enzyme [Desulfobacter sp.]